MELLQTPELVLIERRLFMDNNKWLKDIKQLSKEEMWQELDGRVVRCIHSSEGDYYAFAVQDIETKVIYFLDESR